VAACGFGSGGENKGTEMNDDGLTEYIGGESDDETASGNIIGVEGEGAS